MLRNRTAFLAGVGVLTVVFGMMIPGVEMSYEYSNLLPTTDSAYVDYERFRERFGGEGDVMVVGARDEGFFEAGRLNAWMEMGRRLEEVEGVAGVMDVTRVYGLRKDTAGRRFELERVFPRRVGSQEEADSLRRAVEGLPFYEGVLSDTRRGAYGLMLTLEPWVMGSPERVRVVREVVEVTRAFEEGEGVTLHYSGMPYIRVVNAESIKGEMYLFIVLSLAITTGILYAFFRSARIVGFCLLVVLVCVCWTVGTMAAMGIKITLLTAMLPPLLIVICIPNMVFMINKYHTEYARHGNRVKALQRLIQKIGNASFLSNLTTAAGFGTFIVTSSQILVEFGVIASIGILYVYVLCLVMLPCGFSLMGRPDERQMRHLKNRVVTRAIDGVVRVVVGHRGAVYAATVAVVILGAVGISLIRETGYMVDDLKETDPIRVDLAFFEENFGGLMPLEVTVDAGRPRRLLELREMERIDRLTRAIEEEGDVSRGLSLVEVVKFANQGFYNGKEEFYRLPTRVTRNFVLKYVEGSSGEAGEMARGFVDSTLRVARVSFRVKDVGTQRMEELVARVEALGEEMFPGKGQEVRVTGSSVIFAKGTRYLVQNLFSSLALAIVLIALFMAWMFRSKRMVLVALVPNIVPQLITTAIMGYCGIPIKASTILVFSIAFGISVDGTIHYLAKYRQELQGTNWSIRSSVVLALRETGQSMIYNAIILFFGFGIFALSDFGGTVALGVLVSITLLAAMLSNIFILPSLLLTLDKRTTNKEFKAPPVEYADREG